MRLLSEMSNGQACCLSAHSPARGTRIIPLYVGYVSSGRVFSLISSLPSSLSADVLSVAHTERPFCLPALGSRPLRRRIAGMRKTGDKCRKQADIVMESVTLKTAGSGSRAAIGDSTAVAQSIPVTSGETTMSSSMCKHEAAWRYRRLGGWPILSLDLPPKGPALVSLPVGETARVSFVTAQAEGERLVHPRGRWLASLLYGLPPFPQRARKDGAPFVCMGLRNAGLRPRIAPLKPKGRLQWATRQD
jgi:hypothetical protein